MYATRPFSIAVVGGGASGVLAAAHLLRDAPTGIRITIIEKRASVGKGLAYSTDEPDHLLNVRASNMSAFADDPDHFVRWLDARGVHSADWTTFFAPRQTYGEYLADLLRDAPGEQDKQSGRLAVVAGECIEVTFRGSRPRLLLADGSSIDADCCILATGHEHRPGHGTPAADGGPDDPPVGSSDPVLVAGTGLTMVDKCLSLLLRGHVGPIYAVSRRGLLPAVHTRTGPLTIDRSEIPLAAGLSHFVSWFRDLVRATEAAGGNWRDVVDGLRPHNQFIWQSWPGPTRRRFFRHLKAWWDIHRHRMAPQVHARIRAAIADGQLRVIAGRLLAVEPDTKEADTTRFVAHLQHRGTKAVESIRVARVHDCTGVIADTTATANPVIRSLLRSGAARPDRLHIGLDVLRDGSLVGRNGLGNPRIYAVGPLTRGTFLEIEAIPDIRVQCRELSLALLRRVSPIEAPRAAVG